MPLTPNAIRKAFDELHEDESRKIQAMVQFREWIKKHPGLKNSRQGEFLLNFHSSALSNLINYFHDTKKLTNFELFRI